MRKVELSVPERKIKREGRPLQKAIRVGICDLCGFETAWMGRNIVCDECGVGVYKEATRIEETEVSRG